LAFAAEATEKSIRHKDKAVFFQHFNGIELASLVPACHQDNNPHCRSIAGAKILCVD